MTSPLSSFVAIQFIADPAGSTPPAVAQLDQRIVLVPPEYKTNLGSGPANPGYLSGVYGYLQTGGPTGLQWVMTSALTSALISQFLAIPGGSGWTNTASRSTFRGVAAALLDAPYSVPGPTVIDMLTRLYNAAVANANTPPPTG